MSKKLKDTKLICSSLPQKQGQQLCCGSGSGIRRIFDPWIRDPGWVKNPDNIPDHFSENLETIFWVKILKLFDVDPDPGYVGLFYPRSGMGKIRIRDKHPGSAPLVNGNVP
jgi:hypothetical protein